MAKKKIVAAVTLHVPHKEFKPFEFDGLGARVSGDYRIVEVKPGDPVEIEADEADALIARGLATEVAATKAAPAAAAPTA